jgi:dienelactone hydrolase
VRRRAFLALSAAGASAVAAATWLEVDAATRARLGTSAPARAWNDSTGALRAALTGGGGAPRRPSAPAGAEHLTGGGFYTAVPAGYGDGRGLPVCLILHGASKRPPDYAGMGFGGFLTEAVRRGGAPFVLAGATDPTTAALHADIPARCAAAGFDTTRLAAWGWSLGGAGALRLAETYPGFLRAVAAFSPAVSPGDPVFTAAARLAGTPVGLWCGTDDPLCDDVQALRRDLPAPPVAGGFQAGRHNFTYWSTQIPAAFDFLARSLA